MVCYLLLGFYYIYFCERFGIEGAKGSAKRERTWQEVEDPRHHQSRKSCSHILLRISFQILLTALLALLLGVSLSFISFFFFVYYGILHFYIYLVAHCYACYHPIWCFCLHFPCFPCYHLLNFPIPVYKSHVFWFPCCFIWSLLLFFIWIIFGCFMTGSIVLSAKSVNLYILSIGVSSFLLLVLAFVVVFMNLIESI